MASICWMLHWTDKCAKWNDSHLHSHSHSPYPFRFRFRSLFRWHSPATTLILCIQLWHLGSRLWLSCRGWILCVQYMWQAEPSSNWTSPDESLAHFLEAVLKLFTAWQHGVWAISCHFLEIPLTHFHFNTKN